MTRLPSMHPQATMQHPPHDGCFYRRHIGLQEDATKKILAFLGMESMDALVTRIIPSDILRRRSLDLPPALPEDEALTELKHLAAGNQLWRSYLGQGYYGTRTPTVILRNILENPAWYTAYTPYQAEIAQGRLEALLNFQTMITELTGMEIANASLLDEATAAAEAMLLAYNATKRTRNIFLVADTCHPQTIAVIRTRAQALAIEVIADRPDALSINQRVFGILLQVPDTHGKIAHYQDIIARTHAHTALAIVAADLLSLALFKPPGEFGADVVIGTTQRFGVPMGFGGPHAGYFATRKEYRRLMPGRIVGVSRDSNGTPALRLALQTREQHIRRDRATSNICTAQVLPAVMAGMYAVYHGPEGLRAIATRIYRWTNVLARALSDMGYRIKHADYFDTLHVLAGHEAQQRIRRKAMQRKINLRYQGDDGVVLSLDETVREADVADLISVFLDTDSGEAQMDACVHIQPSEAILRRSDFLQQEVFNLYHTESEMLRYLYRLASKDLSLTTSMIPLGSCTMKLNATSEMIPMTWPEFAHIHPCAPPEQWAGYHALIRDLENMLCEITGFAAVSMQPNAGSQGEYTGLLVIRAYHAHRHEAHRDICLIPQSAHGTNPASAVMAGMRVVPVHCDVLGNIDMHDLQTKAAIHGRALAALMVTYPSTHGVFEERIREVCQIIHDHGGQVYLDGANLNAQVALCRPGDYGADVCHINLHKTFCIPHGGGGPGMGPIAVKQHLAPFLPSHPFFHHAGHDCSIGAVSASPFGSACILPIAWMYIRMMGCDGLRKATEAAILNANYVAKKLDPFYPVLYKGKSGMVAHECILDLRDVKKTTGVDVEDVAKRLMDYGYHAPTISFPVPGTLMIEPTESESLSELDRFCDALILIRKEIDAIETGQSILAHSPLRLSPHTASQTCSDDWDRHYSRESAAYPASWSRTHKYWPPVSRIDNAYGDRNLFCTCPD